MKTRCDEASLSASDSRAVLALSALTSQIHSKSMVRSCHLTSPTSALKLGSLISAKSVVANRVTLQVACRRSSLRLRAALRRNEQGVADEPKAWRRDCGITRHSTCISLEMLDMWLQVRVRASVGDWNISSRVSASCDGDIGGISMYSGSCSISSRRRWPHLVRTNFLRKGDVCWEGFRFSGYRLESDVPVVRFGDVLFSCPDLTRFY